MNATCALLPQTIEPTFICCLGMCLLPDQHHKAPEPHHHSHQSWQHCYELVAQQQVLNTRVCLGLAPPHCHECCCELLAQHILYGSLQAQKTDSMPWVSATQQQHGSQAARHMCTQAVVCLGPLSLSKQIISWATLLPHHTCRSATCVLKVSITLTCSAVSCSQAFKASVRLVGSFCSCAAAAALMGAPGSTCVAGGRLPASSRPDCEPHKAGMGVVVHMHRQQRQKHMLATGLRESKVTGLQVSLLNSPSFAL